MGSMLMSTEAATMPSITLSNVVPFTGANLRYEVFMARMSHSDHIEFNGGYTSGNPQLFGFHIDVEPAPGWTLGLSRIMQYGGGQRPSGFRDLMKAFFNPSSYDNANSSLSTDQEFGNQQVAFSSEFVVPLRFPISTYIEYAAEDTFHSQNFRFGSSALSAGIYLPRVTKNLQLRYEFAEWQTNWYVHHIYQDGMTNYGVVLGQWGAQWRYPGDGVGAQSHALELIWDLRGGRQLDLQYRTALNDNASVATLGYNPDYKRAQELSISVSQPWRAWELGLHVTAAAMSSATASAGWAPSRDSQARRSTRTTKCRRPRNPPSPRRLKLHNDRRPVRAGVWRDLSTSVWFRAGSTTSRMPAQCRPCAQRPPVRT
jgi:hypothetical protein